MIGKTTLQRLKEELGNDYTIRTIDLEQCLYCDFGNGFNVEISGAGSRGPVNIYLWKGDRQPDCYIVKTVNNVERNAEAIRAAVNDLRTLSELILKNDGGQYEYN